MSGLATSLAQIVRPAAGDPQGAIVLLHGRGSDEHDLLPFLDLLDPRRRLAGVTLGGPLHLPPGGRHWYALGGIGTPERESFLASYALLAEALDGLPDAFGVGLERTILGGFSQGSVMAYALGLGAGRPPPAGIVAMSGFLPAVEGWSMDLDARAGLPVWITHGRRDEMIGVEWGRAASERLTAAGLGVTYVETEAAHHADPRALAELPAWVERALG
mgnify:FL=1